MKKDSVKGYALIGIIFILITVVSLAIPTSKSAAFWIKPVVDLSIGLCFARLHIFAHFLHT